VDLFSDVELLEGICTTRAIRRYRPEPIPDDDLARILFAATRAPSGSNRQPFRFVVLRDGPRAREAKAVLGESFRASWAAKQAGDGYTAGSGTDANSPKARTARAMQYFVDTLEQTPVVVLPCVVLDRDLDPTMGASVYPACQNLLLAARALGFGGVLTQWHLMVLDDLRRICAIPDDVWVAACIPLGRPEGGHGPVRRRPVGELVFDDEWDVPAPWAEEPEGTRHAGRPPR